MTIEMYPSDQVADLRAEVTHWYENLQKEQMNQQAQLQEFGQSGRQSGDFPGQPRPHSDISSDRWRPVEPVCSFLSTAGGLMGPVRMISSGHELTTDYDEKTLQELGFKDMQVRGNTGNRPETRAASPRVSSLNPDGVRVSGSSAQGEEGGGRPAACLLPASSSEGAHPHVAAPPGATSHHSV